MNCLVVVAHPDDEVLGAGGTIHLLAAAGHNVNVCVLSADALARGNRPATKDLHSDIEAASGLLGIKSVFKGHFPNLELNTVPHLELVRFVEQAIVDTAAAVVITHHPADLNNDHLHTSIACQAAAKVCQRRPGIPPIDDLLLMEVPSATDWSLNPAVRSFSPNTFVEITETSLHKKLEALSKYRGVMREHPHPRSTESLEGLARYRGSQAGMCFAEAFESVFRRCIVGKAADRCH